MFKKYSWIEILTGVVIAAFMGVLVYVFFYFATYHCATSHEEIQYQQPMSIVVGGSKSGGGVGIPMGNIRQVRVTVCDKYEKNKK